MISIFFELINHSLACLFLEVRRIAGYEICVD
jgi:hypothetical protein